MNFYAQQQVFYDVAPRQQICGLKDDSGIVAGALQRLTYDCYVAFIPVEQTANYA